MLIDARDATAAKSIAELDSTNSDAVKARPTLRNIMGGLKIFL